MRRISLILLVLFLTSPLFGIQKMEVFELQNRDAESLVPVIASALGPDARVTADTRTNSLIVSYPAEMKENLHTIINQLDRAEPNITVEVTTVDVETAFLVKLGIAGRNGLSPNDYDRLLPLLVGSSQAELTGQQSVITKNNLPARIALQSQPAYFDPNRPRPPTVTQMSVIPRLMGNEIELKLTHTSPSLAGENETGQGRVFATSMIPNGGALMFTFNQEESQSRQAFIPIIPLGLGQSKERSMQRLVLLHAETTDYNEIENK